MAKLEEEEERERAITSNMASAIATGKEMFASKRRREEWGMQYRSIVGAINQSSNWLFLIIHYAPTERLFFSS